MHSVNKEVKSINQVPLSWGFSRSTMNLDKLKFASQLSEIKYLFVNHLMNWKFKAIKRFTHSPIASHYIISFCHHNWIKFLLFLTIIIIFFKSILMKDEITHISFPFFFSFLFSPPFWTLVFFILSCSFLAIQNCLKKKYIYINHKITGLFCKKLITTHLPSANHHLTLLRRNIKWLNRAPSFTIRHYNPSIIITIKFIQMLINSSTILIRTTKKY